MGDSIFFYLKSFHIYRKKVFIYFQKLKLSLNVCQLPWLKIIKSIKHIFIRTPPTEKCVLFPLCCTAISWSKSVQLPCIACLSVWAPFLCWPPYKGEKCKRINVTILKIICLVIREETINESASFAIIFNRPGKARGCSSKRIWYPLSLSMSDGLPQWLVLTSWSFDIQRGAEPGFQ